MVHGGEPLRIRHSTPFQESNELSLCGRSHGAERAQLGMGRRHLREEFLDETHGSSTTMLC